MKISMNLFIGSLIGLSVICSGGKESLAARVAGIDQPITTSTSTDPAKKVQSAKPDAPAVGTNGKLTDATQALPANQEKIEPVKQDKVAVPEAMGKKEINDSAGGAALKIGKNPSQSPESSAAKKVSAARQKKQGAERYVTIDFDNVDISVFVKFVSELTGRNFIIDDKVKGKVTIVSPKKIPIEDVYKVFLSVLEVYGFATVPAGDMTKIIPSIQAREKSVETRLKRESKDIDDDRIVTQIITLDHANPDEIKRVLDPIISKSSSVLSYPPAGMLVVTDYLSNIKRLQEIVSALDVESAGDQITYIPLQNAAASEVVKSLSAIFQQRRAGATPIRVVPDSRANALILLASVADTEAVRKLTAFMDKDVPRSESNLQVYRLQNSNAEDLAKVLTNITKENKDPQKAVTTTSITANSVQIVPDKATNTLVIMGSREDYKVLEGIIKKLDVPRPMVYLEALIMEVNTNKAFNIGVEWRGIKDTGSITGMDTGRAAAFVGSGGGSTVTPGGYNIIPDVPANALTPLAFPSGFTMGILGAGISIGGVLFPNIGAVIQAYKQDSEVSILSTPQIMTLDNEEAEINVGSNVPYITRQDSNATISTNVVNYNTYEYRDVGVILNITPHINEENFIRLKISQQVTKVTTGSSPTPTTLKRTAKTTVVIKDNETIVIGGLVGDSTENGTYKVPFLGDIPILGWLFKSRSNSREKTNLYVFLTPHIVRTEKDASKIFQEKREDMGEVVEGVIRLNEKKPETRSIIKPQPTNDLIPDKTED